MAKDKEYQKEVNSEKLHLEIAAVFSDIMEATKYSNGGVYYVHVLFENDKTSSEWLTIDGVVSAHELVSLQDLKNTKNAEIDSKTQALIREGFTFDNNTFSLSDHAQRNWVAIESILALNAINQLLITNPSDAAGIIATLNGTLASMFPLAVSTLDDKEYSFTSFADYVNFYSTGFSIANGHYMSGRALKDQVNQATDVAGINNVIDNR